MHRTAGLQTRHRNTFPEGLPGLDGRENLAAVHNLGHGVPGAEIHYFSSEAKRRCTTCEVEIKSVSGACARPIPEHTRPRIRITSVILLAGYLPKNLDIK